MGKGIIMLVAGLAPDLSVVVGDIARVWDKLGPVVADVLKEGFFTHVPTRIVASALTPQLCWHGIIALVLERHFEAPITA